MLKYFFYLILLQILFGFLEAYHWDGTTMYDLEYQDSSFDSEAAAWYQSTYWTPGVKTSTCDGNRIMGGYEVLGGSNTKGQYWERQYTSLPMPHNVIYLKIRIYPLDSWDYDEDDHFELWFDGIKIIAWTFEGYDSPYALTNVCGDSYRDLKPMWVYATIPHTSSTLTFRVVNSLNQASDDESLGFREITMQFQQLSSPPSTYSFCGVTQGNPLSYNACPCADGTYMYPPSSGICPNCDSTCKTCSAGGSSACLTCPVGRYLAGNTCPLLCDSNCLTCSGSATTCLTCNPGWYLIGTTCYPTCNYPLYTEVVSGVAYCRTPCTGQYVWWDGTCSSTCTYTDIYGEAYTLQPVTINTFLQCNHPCATSQFLYFNTSCLSSCPSPLTIIPYKSRNFCSFPCADTTQYLYWNQSCLSTCPSPFLSEVQGNPIQSKFCWYPCKSNQLLQSDGSCLGSCPSGNFANAVLNSCEPCQDSLCSVCSSSECQQCKDPYILDSNGICQNPTTADTGVKTTFAAVTGSTVGAGLTLGATAALWSIISFQQFVGYFIFLNIQLPPHLIYFLTMFGNVNLEILPNPLASLTNRFAKLWDSLVNNADKKYQLPHKFAEFDTPTLFVVNAGSTFFICIIILLVPFLFDLLRKFKPLGNIKFIQNLHSHLRWNIPIRIFLESGILLTFALLVQMRKISYSNVPYGISTVTAGLAFLYLVIMIKYISQTLTDFKYEDLKEPNVEKSIGTLFEGLVLKKEKPSGKYYYLLILFRGMLLVFVGVFAEEFPVVQTTVMAAFNVFFVYFVWAIIKFESRYLNWTNRIKEVLILISEIFFVTLCYLQTEKYRNLVGWLIIGMLGLTLAMELLFGFYLQVLAVRDFVKMIRGYCKKRNKVRVIFPTTTVETSRNVLTIETSFRAG